MGGGGRGGRQDRRLCVREVCERGGGVGGGCESWCVCVGRGGGQVPRAIRVPEMSSIICFHDLRLELARVT